MRCPRVRSDAEIQSSDMIAIHHAHAVRDSAVAATAAECGDEDARGFYDCTMMLKEGENF